MRIAIPPGNNTGWGLCGKYLTNELVNLPAIPENVTLHAIRGPDFYSGTPEVWNEYNFGICFIEDEEQAKPHIERAKWYDGIIAGSTWNAMWLRKYGINVSSFIQGIDLDHFYFAKREWDGRFIVFSGGKFEYRKGQDIVIAAMRTIMAEFGNVWLSVAWHNPWQASMDTMEMSALIKYVRKQTCRETVQATLEANGIPLDRVLIHPPLDNRYMAGIYRDSDLGVFPNRCEAGTNLVMMEYAACGRTILATGAHGHLDTIPDASEGLQFLEADSVLVPGHGEWYEPKVDQIVDAIRMYVKHPNMEFGEENAAAMKQFTWKRAAREVHSFIEHTLKHAPRHTQEA